MRALPLLLLAATAGCAVSQGNPPSLAPRPAEATDPRIPVAEAPVQANPDPRLVEQLDSLVSQAVAGDQAFLPVAQEARRLAESAGPAQSESWMIAQQALSQAVAARSSVAQAVAEIDSLGAGRIVGNGGMSAGNLEAIKSAAAKLSEIDGREASDLKAVQRLLER